MLGTACAAHALHDGFTDLLYVLLPVWQGVFGLSYREIGLLRALYTGAMAAFQVPASMLAGRIGGPLVLALGTALAGLGFLIIGTGGGLTVLALGLALGGLGSSTQHPIASDFVAQAYAGPRSRAMLGTYNFSGDLGKMILPVATALLLSVLPWPSVATLLGSVGLAAALAIGLTLRRVAPADPGAAPDEPLKPSSSAPFSGRSRSGSFALLLAIGVIDSATRMGFLTFLPFLLAAKGASLSLVGTGLALVFAGGAAGKLVCGILGQRFGVLRTVLMTEGATALGILALLPSPGWAAIAILPLIGIALNGTSSALYGTVPELVSPERRARAFGIFYTGTIGSGAVAPVIYGLFSDALGLASMMGLIAAVVLTTLPLAWLLDRAQRS